MVGLTFYWLSNCRGKEGKCLTRGNTNPQTDPNLAQFGQCTTSNHLRCERDRNGDWVGLGPVPFTHSAHAGSAFLPSMNLPPLRRETKLLTVACKAPMSGSCLTFLPIISTLAALLCPVKLGSCRLLNF